MYYTKDIILYINCNKIKAKKCSRQMMALHCKVHTQSDLRASNFLGRHATDYVALANFAC